MPQASIEEFVDEQILILKEKRVKAEKERDRASAEKKHATNVAKVKEAVAQYWAITEAVERGRVKSQDSPTTHFVVYVAPDGAHSTERDNFATFPPDVRDECTVVAQFFGGMDQKFLEKSFENVKSISLVRPSEDV